MPLTNEFTEQDALDSGNEALTTQAMRLAARKKDLQDKAAAFAQGGGAQPQGQMVGGRYIAPTTLQMLTPVLGQALVEYKKQALDKESSDLDRRVATAAAYHLSHPPAPNATQAEKLAWAQRGAQIPTVAPMMQAYVQDQLVAEPARVEDRAFRKEDRDATRANSLQIARERIEDNRQRNSDNIADRQQRANDSNDLRATLAAAVHAAGGGGGDKASNYQLLTDDEGNVTRVNKLTGESSPVAGKAGKSAGAVVKDQFDKAEKRTNAQKGIELLDQAESLLGKAGGGKAMSLRDTIAGAAGYSTDTAKAGAELDVVGNSIANMIPRMAGQVSDADLKFIQKQAGDLNNRDLPTETRRAAARAVRKVFDQTLRGESGLKAPAGPSIRDAVKAATQPKSVDDLLNKYR